MKRIVRSERRARAGFTLIEMLIAIAILAVIAVLSWRGLDQMIRGRTTITNAMEDERVVAQLFDQMRIDARQAATRRRNRPDGDFDSRQRLADRARHVRAGRGAALAGGALPAVGRAHRAFRVAAAGERGRSAPRAFGERQFRRLERGAADGRRGVVRGARLHSAERLDDADGRCRLEAHGERQQPESAATRRRAARARRHRHPGRGRRAEPRRRRSRASSWSGNDDARLFAFSVHREPAWRRDHQRAAGGRAVGDSRVGHAVAAGSADPPHREPAAARAGELDLAQRARLDAADPALGSRYVADRHVSRRCLGRADRENAAVGFPRPDRRGASASRARRRICRDRSRMRRRSSTCAISSRRRRPAC